MGQDCEKDLRGVQVGAMSEGGIRIVLDARWIFERISGIGRVTLNLVEWLPKVDSRNEYVFLFDDERRMEEVSRKCGTDGRANAETRLVPWGIFSLSGQLKLPAFLKKMDADVFHSTNYMMPLRRCGAKMVVTIHDLIPLKFPEYTPKSRKGRVPGLYRMIMRRVAKTADSVIADSANTEKDIVEYLPAAKGKTKVIHCGLEERYFSTGKEEGWLRERYGIEGQTIITAGRADPYKNTLGLVKAFELLTRKRGSGVHLVIVGEEDARYPEVRDYIESVGMKGRVTMTGYLDDEELVKAYASADVMVHPSRYEGFGLPPLEAMAAGTAVISSRGGSLPEVLGDAAEYVDAEDTEGMARAIGELLDDEGKRAEMALKGRERARRYTWERAARETVKLYEEVAGR